jgi:hypothetical protein
VSPVRYELGFYIPEDGILHSYRCETLKSYIPVLISESLATSWLQFLYSLKLSSSPVHCFLSFLLLTTPPSSTPPLSQQPAFVSLCFKIILFMSSGT